MKVGVCYYPEHWPREQWEQDAQHMQELGLSTIRIGEFAWSRLEPVANQYQFDWLEEAINVLHAAGLKVVLGTPTATPPAWLCKQIPDMFSIDENGNTRGFGSRRHYCFSSLSYREHCKRIVTALAKRFGQHPAISAWQTDNEYGCHSTTISYSEAATKAFQLWCQQRYKTIYALNAAWGNVFWSMEYNSFDDIGPPILAVTELNPAHRFAYWRFSSDQIVSFNKLQTDILRAYSPGRDIVHNFMGNFVEFDHFAVSEELDVATWDNYPLGFLTRDGVDEAEQQRYLRTGHPDSSSFHHDLYRNCTAGRLWLMEQQPGPVNWAPYNPAPVDGMVRLWGWEAFAHGAELVSYFRWRQAPFAQEQMHSGLCLPNGDEDDAAREVRQLCAEAGQLVNSINEAPSASVAIVFDYAGDNAQRIQQPGGQHYDPLSYTQKIYSALRQLGLGVDVISPNSPQLASYKALFLPNATVSDDALVNRLSEFKGPVMLFTRTGSKTVECSIPENLAPGAFQKLINVRVNRVESLPPHTRLLTDKKTTLIDWRERIQTSLKPHEICADGWGFHYQQASVHYINACLPKHDLLNLLEKTLQAADIDCLNLGPDLRIQRRGNTCFAFNFGPATIELTKPQLEHFGFNAEIGFLLGESTLPTAGICIWQCGEHSSPTC